MDSYLRVQIVETHALLRGEYESVLKSRDWNAAVPRHLGNAATLAGIAATLRQGLPQSTRNHRLEIVVDRRDSAAHATTLLESAGALAKPRVTPPEPQPDGRYDPFDFPEEAFRGANGLVDAAMMREVCNHGVPLNDARAARGLSAMPGFPPAGSPAPAPTLQS